ncbi:hypothetical protein CUC53_00465 [Aeromonas cavernicola]|uniref:Uncharacterized protein n=1 Tax=Aeromonas cavernicola TaxID=1006623 RepID=A0A2H9U9H8_9GAMM|nr:hypothetical protein CUC53_00465 [Aeromonas cavernicola]
MLEAGFGQSHGWGRPTCRVRRSVRPGERPEGNRAAVGLAGEETFGDVGSFQRHSPQPEEQAKPVEANGLASQAAQPHQTPQSQARLHKQTSDYA